jgi:hypothetical protein
VGASLSSGTRLPRRLAEAHHPPPKRAPEEDGRCRGSLLGIVGAGSSVARMFREPSSGTRLRRAEPACALPMMTGFRALTFHTLLSFQGASSERSWRLPCGSRPGPVAGAAATLSRAFQARQPSGLSPPECSQGLPPFALAVPPDRRSRRRRPRGAHSTQR